MIAFIWIMTCLFLGFFTTTLKTHGISLGGIPTFLLYFSAFSLAGFLSKLWNNRQHRKYVEQLEKEKSEVEKPKEEKAVDNDSSEPSTDTSEKSVYKVKVSESDYKKLKKKEKVKKKVKKKLTKKAKIIIVSVLALLIIASAEVITIYVMNKNAQTEIELSFNNGYDKGYSEGFSEGFYKANLYHDAFDNSD